MPAKILNRGQRCEEFKMVKPLLAALFTIILCGSLAAQSRPQSKSSPDSSLVRRQQGDPQRGSADKDRPFSLDSINDVLWWLPEDTETVSVVRGPFKLDALDSEPTDDMPGLERVDLTLRMAPLGVLQIIKKGRFYKTLIGRNLLFSVEGSRKFRSPANLGSMLYEGCQIIILQQGLGPARDTIVREMTSNAKQVEVVAGQPVMAFEEKLEEDTWKFFVAIPVPNILIFATNQDFLTQVLKRMHQKGQKRALPEDLPEWKHVKTGAKFWAVRHYDKDDAQEDPSSPLSGKQMAANWPDTEAVGIVFNFDPNRSKAATIKYLSQNTEALKLFTKDHVQPGEGFKPVIRQSEAGVIEMVVSLDEPDGIPFFLLLLFSFLGHAIYI